MGVIDGPRHDAGGATIFTDEGEHQLKGIDGEWRLFSASFGAA